MANYSNLKSNSEVKQRSYITIIMNKIIMLLLFLMIVSMAFPGLSPAENHTAESSGTKMSMESDKQDMNEMKMDMSACKRMVELTNEAEHQLGGAQYTGKMPMKGMAMKMSMDYNYYEQNHYVAFVFNDCRHGFSGTFSGRKPHC